MLRATICCVVAGAGTWTARTLSEKASPSDTEPPVAFATLTVDPYALDVGVLDEGTSPVFRLPMRNSSSEPIRVRDITSCYCLTIEPRSFTVPPGGSVDVRLTFAIPQRTPAEVGLVRRPFEYAVTALHGNGDKSTSWRLHGSINSRMTLDTMVLSWGDELIQGQKYPTRQVIVTAHVPVQSLHTAVDARFATATVRRDATNPNQFTVSVALKTPLPTGSFDKRLGIGIIDLDGKCVPGTGLSLQGTVQPQVRAVPTRVLLGSHMVGDMAEAFVVLQPRLAFDFLVQKIEADSADLVVTPADVKGSPKGRTFRVAQRIARTGEQIQNVRFTVRKTTGETIVVPVEVWYRGEPNRPEGTKP